MRSGLGETSGVIEVGDDIVLESRWDSVESPSRAVVLCHPHPLQQGTMTAPLMTAVTAGLVKRGFAVLRFNFRGVGKSTGRHEFGVGEMDDIAAAVSVAESSYPNLPLGVTGWSFGAATSLAWQARDKSALAWAGIAPPIRQPGDVPPPSELAPARRTLIIGDRDQFTTVAVAEEYAAEIGADVVVLKGSDHFFHFREERVAEAVAAALAHG